MLKKTIAAVMAFCLLGQNLAFAAPDTETPSLRELQAQAKADWTTFHQKYGKQSEQLLPVVTATFPLIFIRASKLKALGARASKLEALEAKVSKLEALEARLAQLEKQNKRYSDQIFHLTNEKSVLNRAVEHYTSEREVIMQELQHLQTIFDKAQQALMETQKVASATNRKKINALLEEIAQLRKTPLDGLSKEELLAFRIEVLNSEVFSKAKKELLEEGSGFTYSLGEDAVSLIETGSPKDLFTFRRELHRYKSDEILWDLNKLRDLYKREGGYTVKFMREATPLLEGLSKSRLRVPERRIISDVSKRILSKSGLLGIGLLTIGCVTLAGEQSADAQVAVAQRIAQNPELFINATPDELETIENNELATNTAREIAQALHMANELSQEDMDFVRQNYQQQEQGRLVKKSITSSLRTVSAH